MSGGGGTETQYFSLRWNNHQVNLVQVFTRLYQNESLVDVTLAAEGRHLQAHKVVLSACSDYFQALFAANPSQHPIVILKDVGFDDLETVVKFMYYGIVNVAADKLPGVLKTADALQIKGLEKNTFSPYLGPQRLLPVPPHHGRQPSTESLPEYLHRSRSEGGAFPHRAHSAESRGLSFDSGPIEISRHKRTLSPPGSPDKAFHIGSNYARKKFRNRSDNGSSSVSIEPGDGGGGGTGSSLEKEAGSGSSLEKEATLTGSSDKEGRVGGSSSVEGEKIKEEVKDGSPFPDRSPSHYSGSDTEHIAKKKRAMFQARKGGSGSGSKSSDMHNSSTEGRSDKENKRQESTSQSSSQSISHSSDKDEAEGFIKDTLQVPGQSRTLVRAVSASEIQHGALTTKFKRGRFLKRQQCQESTEEAEASVKSEPPSSPPAIALNNTLVKQHSQPLLPSQSLSPSSRASPPPPPLAEDNPLSPVSRQPSLDPLCGLESVPLLYTSSGPGPRLPPSSTNLLRPMPSVRVIPEPEPMHELVSHPPYPPIPSPSLLYPGMPGYEHMGGGGGGAPPYHHHHHPHHPHHVDRKPQPKPRHQDVMHHSPVSTAPSSSSSSSATRQSPPSEQYGHCPKARDGPALSCNYCWNTTDGSGRILRRKTKYLCPECQTNLCIVPCFQQFHAALEAEGGTSNH